MPGGSDSRLVRCRLDTPGELDAAGFAVWQYATPDETVVTPFANRDLLPSSLLAAERERSN